MALAVGTRFGPYEIVAPLGAGGMGEVYKARDTRLDRTVAIKVLPPSFAADAGRRARFEREAKAIAALNHPHICTLHDVGDHDGSLFLVMEHVAGETLAERLRKGPLLLDQALALATEIADALAAAHRQGIVHRDLKPGNVMMTKAGAKLLDFGLAKLTGHGEQPAAAHLMSAPTQSKPLTREGMIVGTLQYMAPEQVEGKPADARADVWALGAILYEMLTGKRAFEGTSAASLIGAILEREPVSIATLQPLTPPSVDPLVRQCLAKAPEDRPDTTYDVANELRRLRDTSRVPASFRVQPRRRPTLRSALFVAAVAVVAAMIGAGLVWLLRPLPQLAGLALSLSPADELDAGGVSSTFLPTRGGSRTAFTWTPDGRALVFVGRRAGVQQLYVRRLDAAEARPLANTEGAQMPAVSPDGQWVAFWAQQAIKKAPLGEGPVTNLAAGIEDPPRGLAWDAHGGVFFSREDDGRIWQISPDATPKAVTTVGEAEVRHTLPWVLPGERALFYTVRKREWSWGDEEVVAQTFATGARNVLLKDAVDARYVPTGHLVFLRRGVLLAVAFDADRLVCPGTGVAVLDGVAQALVAANSADATGAGQFAIAATGTLAWIPSPVVPYQQSVPVTVDRLGHVSPLSPLPAPVRSYGAAVRVSPDGRRLAVTIQSLTALGRWVYDPSRGTLMPLVGGGDSQFLVWAPGGRLVFEWLKDGRSALAWQPADGTMQPEVLAPGNLIPSSWTTDGRKLALALGDTGVAAIATVENGRATVRPLGQTADRVQEPEFSPDGRWLAYVSNVSDRDEVYVRPYPGPGPAEQVSIEGGTDPAWHPKGHELFYVGLPNLIGKRRMMAVDIASGSPPRIGSPKRLFEFDNRDLIFSCAPVRCFDVAPDGQRFYVFQWRPSPPLPAVTHINIVQNWFEELKAKVPVGR